MKRLPKHLRRRHRYLAVGIETWPGVVVDRRAFQRVLWQSIRDLHGDEGSAVTDPVVIRFELADGVGDAVIRVRREAVSHARASLACINQIDTDPVGLWIKGIAGTIRACEEKYIGERPEEITERNVVFGGATTPAVVRNGRFDVRGDGAFTGATDLDFQSE